MYIAASHAPQPKAKPHGKRTFTFFHPPIDRPRAVARFLSVNGAPHPEPLLAALCYSFETGKIFVPAPSFSEAPQSGALGVSFVVCALSGIDVGGRARPL